jgi:hypothetical protein
VPTCTSQDNHLRPPIDAQRAARTEVEHFVIERSEEVVVPRIAGKRVRGVVLIHDYGDLALWATAQPLLQQGEKRQIIGVPQCDSRLVG